MSKASPPSRSASDDNPERFITPRQRAIHESFMRTRSQSETAREMGISQIRVREALVQRERNLIRAAGGRPQSLKRMQQGDIAIRFGDSRDLRQGRPAKHVWTGGQPVAGPGDQGRTRIEVIGGNIPRVLVVTGLDGNSDAHTGFLENLEAYAADRGGELRIHAFGDAPRCPRPTGRPAAADNVATVVADSVEIRPDMRLPSYARYPLDGLQRVAPGRCAVLLHGTAQLESLPRLATQPPRIQMTSGLASPSRKVVGHRVTGEYEPLGAAIIEIDNAGAAHVRRVSAAADGDGSFHDLDVRVAGGRVERGVRVQAIVLGDIHHPLADDAVVAVTWGEGGLVDRLRPRNQVMHDLVDFHARSHHDARDHHARYRRYASGRDDVRAELAGAAAFLARTRRPGCTTHVVASNHDLALTRWLRESDHRSDPRNAEFQLECERIAYARMRAGVEGDLMPDVLRSLSPDRLDGVEFVADGASLMIAGVEHGLHGDRGPDGKRGSVSYLESMGIDMTVGHFHRPAIRGGVYVAGMCSSSLGYERGPTARAIGHVVTHADGMRQHVLF